MSKLPPSSPMSHKIIVGTLAVGIGIYAFMKAGSDFQFVKFEPRLPEEVERRKRDKIGMSMTQLDQRTLDYTPEAKERIRKSMEAMEKNSTPGEK